ncbi:MAG: HAD-IC family P-type ATPase [Candidatus Dadabacteria bacterium]|nr:HAD-IC family P-type ATPase [Candidatus Dadabacteria bacterium]NIS08473.1 HAD-IC family P-type ATPase [Candidatus Dadabacteria bacterium]NIY21961.1 HAD-IC family P-type ATPase [Candidatus Dadabacteria bacterium]
MENNTAAKNPNSISWHAQDAHISIALLNTDLRGGLDSREAGKRLSEYGPNLIRSVNKQPWHTVFVRQFKDVLILILIVAAAVAVVVGEINDAITITIIVTLNGILGFVQEWKAEKAIEALQRMMEPVCNVVRNGASSTIEAKNLVPGDIVLLETGDRVPADLRIAEQLNLKADESVLTGESLSVNKSADAVSKNSPLSERSSIAWMGTTITNGRARCVVVATGMETEFGRIARLTETIKREKTPLQNKLGILGKQLGAMALIISSLVAASGFILGKELLNMFFTGVALAVAIVPEGLPAVVTVTLALGIRSMVRRRALLRRLQAGETLGSATVICTDKTGTLTKNQMTLQKIWLQGGEVEVTGIGYKPEGVFQKDGNRINPDQHHDLMTLLQTGLNCNHSSIALDGDRWYAIGEPTESALVVAAMKAGLDTRQDKRFISEFSFNSIRKRMTIVEQSPESLVAHVKGAPEVIIERSSKILDIDKEKPITDTELKKINDAYKKFAEMGLRTLALARRQLPKGIELEEEKVECELTLIGIVGIIDPPRAEVPNAIRLAHSAGIKEIMITGDASATALAIARMIGMKANRAISGEELCSMDNEALKNVLSEEVLFARTTPEDKLMIVKMLQDMGHVVGMTGDGVNDAPALKRADIGIAMGLRGTEVAKGASDIVLTDDNFASIIGAVEEGRRQYDSIQKFVRYLLSSNTGEVIAIFMNIILGGPLILLPVQILWMNLITDGVTAVALGLEPAEKGIMQRPPRKTNEPILNRPGITKIAVLGSYMGAVTLLLFYDYLYDSDPQTVLKAQTVAFTGLIILEKINVLNFRALRAPLFKIGYLTNPWILVAMFAMIGLQVCAVYIPFLQDALHTVPLSLADWGVIMISAVPIFIIFEVYKIVNWRLYRKEGV